MGRVLSRYLEQSLLTLFENQDRFRSRVRELNEMNPLAMMKNMMESTLGFRSPRSGSSSRRRQNDEPES